MHIHWWTLALQAINVLILVWLLARFLYRPVMDAIAARQRAADALLADAQAAKEEAAAQAAALQAEKDNCAADAARHQAAMLASVEAERLRLLQQAQTEAALAAKQADAAITDARARMTVILEEKAGILAGRMAETLLRRMPAASATEAMFQALLDRLHDLSDAERRKLADDAPLRIVTATPIEDAARARFLSALATALPISAPPDFVVDPALVAGFELHGQHMRVRNSWRADLDGMLAKLKEGEHDRDA